MSNTVVVSLALKVAHACPSNQISFEKYISNALTATRHIQGSAYAQIIERVVQASQIDFEEGGIERQTLNELRDVSVHNLFFENSFLWREPHVD